MNTHLTIGTVLATVALAVVIGMTSTYQSRRPERVVPSARPWEPAGRPSQAPTLITTTLG